jgi:hypothetical protein
VEEEELDVVALTKRRFDQPDDVLRYLRAALRPRFQAAVRVHRVVSTDGTAIAARVHGEGRPLVLVHGGLGDDTSWSELLAVPGRTLHLLHQRTPGTRDRCAEAESRRLPDEHP